MQQKPPLRRYCSNNAVLLAKPAKPAKPAKLWTLATVVGGLLFGAVVATVGTRLANANAAGFGPDAGGSPQHAYHVNPAAVLQTQSLQRSIDGCTLGHYGQGAIGLRYKRAAICDPRRQNGTKTSSGVRSGGHRRRRASTSRGSGQVVQEPAHPEVRPSKAGGSVHHPRTATLVFISALIDTACRAWRAGAV